MKSNKDSLWRSRLMRRTATVTISAPLASMARAVSCPDLYLPVPTISRERKPRPAITRESMGLIVIQQRDARAAQPPSAVPRPVSLHHDALRRTLFCVQGFDLVAIFLLHGAAAQLQAGRKLARGDTEFIADHQRLL